MVMGLLVRAGAAVVAGAALDDDALVALDALEAALPLADEPDDDFEELEHAPNTMTAVVATTAPVHKRVDLVRSNAIPLVISGSCRWPGEPSH